MSVSLVGSGSSSLIYVPSSGDPNGSSNTTTSSTSSSSSPGSSTSSSSTSSGTQASSSPETSTSGASTSNTSSTGTSSTGTSSTTQTAAAADDTDNDLYTPADAGASATAARSSGSEGQQTEGAPPADLRVRAQTTADGLAKPFVNKPFVDKPSGLILEPEDDKPGKPSSVADLLSEAQKSLKDISAQTKKASSSEKTSEADAGKTNKAAEGKTEPFASDRVDRAVAAYAANGPEQKTAA